MCFFALYTNISLNFYSNVHTTMIVYIYTVVFQVEYTDLLNEG